MRIAQTRSRKRIHAIMLACSLAPTSCRRSPDASTTDAVTRDVPPPIAVPAHGARVRVVQRTKAALPGSGESVTVSLGDITGGRVHIDVAQAGAVGSLASVDAAPGDVVRFSIEGHAYALRVETMRNELIGDDWVDLLLLHETSGAGDLAVVDERVKIEALIATVSRAGIVFIRNGSEHSAEEAASHLRDKWSRAGDKIRTVDDFIEKIASRSSQSGEAYRVRLQDGTEVEAGPWLRAQVPQNTP